jgi:hypothetical protein
MIRDTVRQSRHKTLPLFSRRLAILWATIFVLMVSLVSGGTVFASHDALPGDVLHPVKLSIEDARLYIANDAQDVLLATGFVQTRLEEIEALIEADREEDLYLAADLFATGVASATEALAKVAERDPEHAAQLALVLEEALSIHIEVLMSNLESVPDQAKPAIAHAILSSNRGQEILQNLIEDGLPGGGPPEGIPTPPVTQPGGDPQDEDSAQETPPPGGPPDDAGPPTWVPSGKP